MSSAASSGTMTRLVTLVQISDLHIGDSDLTTGNAKMRKAWAKAEWFEGFLGHSATALQRLEKCFDELRRSEQARLVTTGDLTAFGSADQFRDATGFLRAHVRFGSRPRIGLAVEDWKRYTIPGNHDHWPGKPFWFGDSTASFYDVFDFVPYWDRIINLGNGQRLRFIGIDTDADVGPMSPARLLAQGVFAESLEHVRKQVPDPDPNEIRVLLIHHSYLAPDRGMNALQIAEPTRTALNDFLVEKDIAVVLTGHVHDPLVKRFVACKGHDAIDVIEARCGTTTQITSLPYEMTDLLGRRPGWPDRENSLLVHRLYREVRGTIFWAIEGWRHGRKGFERGPVYPSNVPIEESWPVWPQDQRER